MLTRRLAIPVRRVLLPAQMSYSDIRRYYRHMLDRQEQLIRLSLPDLVKYLNDTLVVIAIGNKL